MCPAARRRLRATACLLAGLMLGLLTAPAPLDAGQSCTEDAMIVFDGSGSMSQIALTQMGVPRISEARQALRQVIPEIAAARRLGLVIYGPSGDRICRNVDLRFGPQWRAAPRILDDVRGLRPAGGTPLTQAVREAARALDYKREPGVVVLVTDGDETCGGAPCQLAAELAAEAPGLTVHVIGFKVRGKRVVIDRDGQPVYSPGDSVAQCLANQTGGQYFGTETVQELISALRVTLGCNLFGALAEEPGMRRF